MKFLQRESGRGQCESICVCVCVWASNDQPKDPEHTNFGMSKENLRFILEAMLSTAAAAARGLRRRSGSDVGGR